MPGRRDDEYQAPVYPEITKAQWAVLSAMTDQRCEHMMEAMDFVADLSPEAKNFLKGADADKVKEINATLKFFSDSKVVWKFLWVGGAMFASGLAAWKTLGEYISVKWK